MIWGVANQKLTYPRKYVRCASGLLLGVRSGRTVGTTLNIARSGVDDGDRKHRQTINGYLRHSAIASAH